MNFTYWVTKDCNLACDYCYVNKSNKYMTKEIAKKSFDFSINKIKEKNAFNQKTVITLHGGEPFLNFEVVKYIVEAFKEQQNLFSSLRFSITTNGTVVNEEIIKFIKNNINYSFSISVDGTQEVHNKHRRYKNGNGTYKKVISTLIRFKEENIRVRVRMTVTPETVMDIYDNFVFFYEKGFRSIPFIPNFYDERWDEESLEVYNYNFRKIIEFLKKKDEKYYRLYLLNLRNNFTTKKKCGGGKTSFHIDTNGDIYPCIYSVGEEDYVLGNVSTEILDDRLKQLERINGVDNQVCSDCSFYDYCDTKKCKIVNKSLTGDYYTPCPVQCHMNNITYKILRDYNVV